MKNSDTRERGHPFCGPLLFSGQRAHGAVLYRHAEAAAASPLGPAFLSDDTQSRPDWCNVLRSFRKRIRFSFGHVSAETTEHHPGCKQRIPGAINNRAETEPATRLFFGPTAFRKWSRASACDSCLFPTSHLAMMWRIQLTHLEEAHATPFLLQGRCFGGSGYRSV